MSVDMSPAAVTRRIVDASTQSDLAPARRLDAKLDMSPAGVSRRLREVSELLELCRRVAARPSPT